MAKFGQQFLANLNVDPLARGMFEFGQGLGAAPRNAILTTQIKDEKDRREKGIIGGMMAIQQAAAAGQLTPDMASAAAESLQGLGMDPMRVASTLSKAATTNTAKQKELTIRNRIGAYGDEYVNLLDSGLTPAQVIKRIDDDLDEQGRIGLAESLGIDADRGAALTAKQLFDLADKRKKEDGAIRFTDFVKNNGITSENRNEVIQLAFEAFGKDALSKVATLENQQLVKEEKLAKRKIVKATVTLSSDAMTPGSVFGSSKMREFPVSLTEDGQLTPKSERFLEDNAVSAFIPALDMYWKPKGKEATPSPTPTTGKAPTLGSLVN